MADSTSPSNRNSPSTAVTSPSTSSSTAVTSPATASSSSTTTTPNTFSSSLINSIVSNTPVTPTPESPSTKPSSTESTVASSVQVTLSTSTSSSNSTYVTGSHDSSNSHLTTGAVAGIVIGVALGLALITFIATYLFLRRRNASKRREGSNRPGDPSLVTTAPPGNTVANAEQKSPFVTDNPSTPSSTEYHLPQSADDQTMRTKAQTLLDQIDLHIENFYQDLSTTQDRFSLRELNLFNSPHLPSTLENQLSRTQYAKTVIKHALAQFIVAAISPSGNPERSLLPDDFLFVSKAVKPTDVTKPGFEQSLSHWRGLTAYLRSPPAQDSEYILRRDEKINAGVKAFLQAFGPWKKSRYTDTDRAQSLSAILKDATELGVWLFSQPCDLRFQWPRSTEVGTRSIAVMPAFVKITDETGHTLARPQILVDTKISRIA